MAKIDIWMPIYIGDYLGDTTELSAAEHGAYLLLLMHYWVKKGEIGDDVERLARVCKSEIETCRFILGYYFTLENGNYRNKRADIEMSNAEKRRVASSENGKKGGRPTKNNLDETQQVNSRLGLANLQESSSSSSSSSSIPSSLPLVREGQKIAYPINDGMSRISKAQSSWNYQGLPPSKKLIFSGEDSALMLDTIRAYTDIEIDEAIGNYAKILTSTDYDIGFEYGSFQGFMKSGVEKFVNEAEPFEKYRKEVAGKTEKRTDFTEYDKLMRV